MQGRRKHGSSSDPGRIRVRPDCLCRSEDPQPKAWSHWSPEPTTCLSNTLVYYPGHCASHWDCENKELNLCLRGLGARQPGRQAAVKHNKQPVKSKQLPDSCCAPAPMQRAPHALSYLINAVTSWVSTIYSHRLTHCVVCVDTRKSLAP